MNAVHRVFLKGSFGRLGWTGMGMPVVELTTTGRKSGEQRRTMLTSPLQLGDTLVVVASRGGDDRNPAWFHNIKANGDVTVTTKAGTRRMHGRVASAEERADLWPRVAADHANYAGYQRKTEREIPLVLLEPAAEAD